MAIPPEHHDASDWAEYRQMVLFRLQQLAEGLRTLQDKQDNYQMHMDGLLRQGDLQWHAIHDQSVKAIHEQIAELGKQVADLNASIAGVNGRASAWGAAVALIVAIISAVIGAVWQGRV